MIDLDDLAALRDADPSDALGTLERIDEQWVEAMRRARAVVGLPTRHGIGTTLVCGMGGSGIAGDVLDAVARGRGGSPVTVVKGYQLPEWVGPNTLVIACSYSGNTEETLACFEQAVQRKVRLVAITTGGELAQAARSHGVCVIPPVEGLQPRQAFVSLAIPALLVAERLGLVRDLTDELAEAEGVLVDRAKLFGRDQPREVNEAKRIAEQLDGVVPLIWGQEGVLEVAAARWRCQLNENAKVPAFSSVLPELDHNEIVGYDPGVPALADIGVVVLRGPEEHPGIVARIDATLDEMRGSVRSVVEARAVGSTPLARLMSSVLLGDFVSVYLAIRRGIDPTPVIAVEQLKRRLSDAGSAGASPA